MSRPKRTYTMSVNIVEFVTEPEVGPFTLTYSEKIGHDPREDVYLVFDKRDELIYSAAVWDMFLLGEV